MTKSKPHNDKITLNNDKNTPSNDKSTPNNDNSTSLMTNAQENNIHVTNSILS